MNRAEKQKVIEEMAAAFKAAKGVFVTDYQGLTVEEITKLRSAVRKAGARIRVVKNTLLSKAVAGSDYAVLKDSFTGMTAVVTAPADPVAAAKALKDFAKEVEKLKIRAGAMGAHALSKAEVEALAELPGLDQLRSKLVGLLQAPASRIVGVLQAPGGQIARVLKAYSEKQ